MIRRSLPLVVVFACSPANPTPNIAQPPPLVIAEAGPARAFASPARWSLFPGTWTPAAQTPVPDGTLQVGAGGERWLHQIPSGISTPAPNLAPEMLVGVAPAAGGFRFAGKSGTLYDAPSALAPLARTGEPVKGARDVALGDKAILAIDANGDLLRATDGRDWKKIDVAQRDGVFVDLAMHGKVGLLVAAPQRLHFTTDDGLTWKTVSSPGDGIRRLELGESGIELEGGQSTFAFNAQTATFTPVAPRSLKKAPPSRAQRLLAMDGKTAMVVESDDQQREHKVAVFDIGTQSTPKKIDALDGCVRVTPAIRGTQVYLACDAVGSTSSGINADKSPLYQLLRNRPAGGGDGGKETGMITRLFKSEDRGKTFTADVTFDGGQVEGFETSFFLGENGFAYLGARCAPYGSRSCVGARVRTGGAWIEIQNDTGKHIAFASRVGQPAYSISIDGQTTALYKWAQGAGPEQVAILSSHAASVASIDVGDDVVRGFVRADAPRAFEVKGNAVGDIPIPKTMTSVAFAGKLVLGVDGKSNGWESIDGGRNWYGTGVPAGTNHIVHCEEDGCLTSRGFRAGWEGSGPPNKDLAAPARWAKPLRCKATGAWTSLGGGDLPTAENVDEGSLRWLAPTRTLEGAVTLHTNKWSDGPAQTTKTAMIGAAPQPPSHGAATTMHVQPNGVVVLRYSYVRSPSGSGRYNPVDFNAVWYRPSSGKIFRAALPKLPAFRVNHDPRYDHNPTPQTGEWPEIAWIGSKGLHFRAPIYPGDEEWTLHHLRDDGRIDKVKIPELRGNEGRVVDLANQITIVATDGPQWGVFGTTDRKEIVYGVMGGDSMQGDVSLFDFGGKPAFLGTITGANAKAWAIPLGLSPDLQTPVAMPTQTSLGESPKGCDAPLADPKGFRALLPYAWGTRHPVNLEIDGIKHVLATARSTVHGVAGGDVCTAAYEVEDPAADDSSTEAFGALVFPSDPNASILFRSDRQNWPDAISVRSMSCTFESGPLPSELEDVQGFKAP